MELYIVWTQDVPESNSLGGFPYGPGQHVDREGEGPAGSGMATWIEMGDAEDTTTAQEQFLNSSPYVQTYEIREA